ncbi:chloramphenicol phosphotransferase CPT family protein [Actinoplanes solisilvae]|uniref:chloramphenicol phosphotransferase CPT family protein n=1 Tax=Actinoplanes solisilvae TaxID=2486853 RepID=UPI00196B1082|nr:chloramphenicol phosphotransferase [Actinoplanes solisilvae]
MPTAHGDDPHPPYTSNEHITERGGDALIIFLNGGSSSGKTSVAQCLKHILGQSWLSFSIDDFVNALSPKIWNEPGGLTIGETGEVVVGDRFRELEAAWYAGLARMAERGADLVVDDVLLDGSTGQRRVAAHLAGIDVLWAGLKCDGAVAELREIARGDRQPGMARQQSEKAHAGVTYDILVDVVGRESYDCAQQIADLAQSCSRDRRAVAVSSARTTKLPDDFHDHGGRRTGSP